MGFKMPKVEVKERSAKEWFLGSYDYGYLCKPAWPFGKQSKREPPQFFEVNAWLGILTATIMGLQHALSMIGGLISPATLVGQLAFNDPTLTRQEALDIQQYLISASLIICGITTMIQVKSIPLPFSRQWGAGVLSVMGVSFTTVSIATTVVTTMMKEGQSFSDAYGKLIGTVALCGLVPVIISFMPHRVIKRVFPPIVCGITIMLIGIYLAGKGMANWGGGAFCGDNYKGLDGKPLGACTFFNTTTSSYQNATSCYTPKVFPVKCSGNGDVLLPFGSPEYVGLGFSVFAMLIIIELFGSPFLRNISVIIALLFGYMLAGVTSHDGKDYVTSSQIDAAPAITFLWTTTFPLKIYGPAVLPLVIIYCITSIETVGDVTATEEASFIATLGPKHEKRIRGALLNDGLSSIFSGLATSLPLTTFAQNNGVIALTAVASRQAGYACAAWLFLFGIIGKFGAFITTIPNCVLGGMTTFLFANVIASGIKIIANEHLNRRNRFIMACSLGLGIGVTIYPQWANTALWPCTDCSSGVKSLRDAIILILSSGLTLGAITACILNLLLPAERALLVPEPSMVKQASLAAEPTVRYKTDSGNIVDSSDGHHVDTTKAFDSDDSHSGAQAPGVEVMGKETA